MYFLRMKVVLVVLSLLVIFCNIVSCANIDEEINNLMQDIEVKGLAVAVVKENSVVFCKSYGIKNDVENLEEQDLFRIASVSKTFVATAIMQLMEAGKLDLRDNINDYLKFNVQNPLYPDSVITLEMLLSHRSSINDKKGYDSFSCLEEGSCFENFPPGDKFYYSNMNYCLLAAIIENIVGYRFDYVIKDSIISPMGLNASFNLKDVDATLLVDTYYYDRVTQQFLKLDNIYHSIVKDESNYVLGYSVTSLEPAGGLLISSYDLAKYMQMHMNNGILENGRRVITEESETDRRKVRTKEINYGLSFRRYSNLLKNKVLYGQTGGSRGVYSAMIFDPVEKYGFVILCNGCKTVDRDGYSTLHKRAINILYDKVVRNI